MNRWIVFALILGPILILLPAALWMALRTQWRRARRVVLRRQGRCVECGYDLRASRGRCPECGNAIRQPP